MGHGWSGVGFFDATSTQTHVDHSRPDIATPLPCGGGSFGSPERHSSKEIGIRSGEPIYRKDFTHLKGRTLIALASLAHADVSHKLVIDWTALGVNSPKVQLTASVVDKLQPEQVFSTTDNIPIKPGQGWPRLDGHREGSSEVNIFFTEGIRSERPMVVERRSGRHYR